MTTEHLLRVSSEDPDAGPIPRLWTVARDAEGRFWTSFASDQVLVYDREGRVVDRLGQRGGGPGEYREVTAIVPVADSMALFDMGNARLTVVSSDLGVVRSLPLIGWVASGAALEWPRMVVNGSFPTAAAGGYPFHILDMETGQIERSFGGSGDIGLQDVEGLIGHVAVDPATGEIWTSFRRRFQIQRWSSSGDLLETYTGLKDWFSESSRGWMGSPTTPPDGVVSALYVGEDGLVRLGVQGPAPSWRVAWRGVPASAGHERPTDQLPDARLLYQTHVAVLDPAAGKLIAIRQVPELIRSAPMGVIAIEDARGMYPVLLVLRYAVDHD